MESLTFQLIVFATCVVFAIAVGLYDQEFDDEWQAWKITHKKTYADEGEETMRRLIWQENLEFIVKHNLEHQRGLHSYRLGMNAFGDMVWIGLTDLTIIEKYKNCMGGQKGQN